MPPGPTPRDVMLRTVLPWSVVAALFMTVACDDSPTEPEDPAPTSDLACDEPTLAVSAAEPFDRVAVSGIEGLSDEVWAEYETASGATGVTVLFVDESGEGELLVPAHPDDLMGGGPLEVMVTDGIGRCGPLEIEVSALDPVAGDPLADVHAAMDDLARALATQFGADPAAVASTSLDALPPQEVPLALLLEMLDALDPATALDGMTADEAAFTQALLAKFDLESTLRDQIASVQGLTAQRSPGMAAPASAAATPKALDCDPLGAVPPEVLGIQTPEALADFMEAARGARDALGPLKQNISDTGAAFAALGLAAPPVGAIYGWMAFGASTLQQMRASLYPSAITRLEVQLDTQRIEEDWDTSRGDPEIRWSFAKIWATNEGMSLTRVGLDLITTKYALPGGFRSGLANAGVAALDFQGKNALNQRLDELQNDPDGGAECWGVAPSEFGPVVIPDDSGDEWLDAGLIAGDAVSVDPEDIRHIRPERVGTGTVRIVTQAEKFPGPVGILEKTFEVVRKKVVWIPSTLLVDEPGETVTVKFRVDDARHAGPSDVEVEADPVLGELPAPTYANGVNSITFTTPSDREDYPTWIDARSTSKELPPDTPPRQTRLDIFGDEKVEITPRELCVDSGESQLFTAEVTGPEELTVGWEIESGAGNLLSTSGETVTYTAPSDGSSGEVVLRAYLEQNPEVEDRVTFRYGVCSGLAVYYGQALEISFPFSPGGDCDNPDLDQEFEEITLPQEGSQPLVPPAPADLWIGRSETFTQALSGAGTFGKEPPGEDFCVTAGFLADAELDATLTGSDDATRLDLDVVTRARSNCEDMGEDFGLRNSGAVSSMVTAARFDFDLEGAESRRLRVELEAMGYVPPGIPGSWADVNISIVRVEPDGTVLPPTGSTAPITASLGPEQSTLSVDRVMEFAAPAEPGQVDHVMVLFSAVHAIFGSIGMETGQKDNSGFLRGFVSVDEE